MRVHAAHHAVRRALLQERPIIIMIIRQFHDGVHARVLDPAVQQVPLHVRQDLHH